jgi:hypothetical protein
MIFVNTSFTWSAKAPWRRSVYLFLYAWLNFQVVGICSWTFCVRIFWCSIWNRCCNDTTEGPSCKNNENSGFENKEFAPVVDHIHNDGDDRDSSNAPYDPNKCIPGNECPPRCPEGWTPATPPLNPQLGCLPDSITSNPGVQPGEDDGVLQSDDETTRGENEDLSSMLSATPSTVQDSSEQEDEEDEADVDVDEDDVKEEVERNNEDGNVK